MVLYTSRDPTATCHDRRVGGSSPRPSPCYSRLWRDWKIFAHGVLRIIIIFIVLISFCPTSLSAIKPCMRIAIFIREYRKRFAHATRDYNTRSVYLVVGDRWTWTRSCQVILEECKNENLTFNVKNYHGQWRIFCLQNLWTLTSFILIKAIIENNI
jgi:hypothetical protein